MTDLKLIHVTKVFSTDVVAVDDLSLEVDTGELLVLLGPSGCGKSTLLRMIAGLEPVTDGEIWLGDTRIDTIGPQDRNVAMVFQNYALYPHMSVRDNLAFPLRMRRLPPQERARRIDSTADMLGLRPLLDRRPRELSGGQRQRVAMGRALVREPRLFLLDEPLSNLDAKLRAGVRAEIAKLQRRLGATTVYVTHDQVEAMTLGDRIAVLADGRLQQIGTARTLYDWPANVFVAGFLGSPPMNVFPARLRTNGPRGWRLDAGGCRLPVTPPVADRCPTLARFEGQELLAGLRPEAFRLASADRAALATTLVAIEPLGHETLLYVESPVAAAPATGEGALRAPGAPAGPGPRTDRWAVRVPGGFDLEAGMRVHLEIDPSLLRLFAPDGSALTLPAPSRPAAGT